MVSSTTIKAGQVGNGSVSGPELIQPVVPAEALLLYTRPPASTEGPPRRAALLRLMTARTGADQGDGADPNLDTTTERVGQFTKISTCPDKGSITLPFDQLNAVQGAPPHYLYGQGQ